MTDTYFPLKIHSIVDMTCCILFVCLLLFLFCPSRMFQSLLVIPQYLLSFSSLVLEPQIFRRAMAIRKKDHISQPPLLTDDYICLF